MLGISKNLGFFPKSKNYGFFPECFLTPSLWWRRQPLLWDGKYLCWAQGPFTSWLFLTHFFPVLICLTTIFADIINLAVFPTGP